MQIALASVFCDVLVSPGDAADTSHRCATCDTRNASRVDCARRCVREFMRQVLLPALLAARTFYG
jgi:uncharacterized hydantoinase/oxoprolinase family protein